MSNSEQSYAPWQAGSQALEGTSVDDYAQKMHEHTKAQLEKTMRSAGNSSLQKNALKQSTASSGLHHQDSSSNNISATSSSDSFQSDGN